MQYTPQDWLRLDTLPRRRMAAIIATAVLFLSYVHAFDVVVPLWVTHDLGFSPSDWARLRSLRFTGVMVGILVLGAVSDRLGQRRVGAVMLVLASGVTAVLSIGQPWAVWGGMFLLGALISTAFVNINTLTQEISERRRGMVNAVYRGVGQAMKIVAPTAATALAAAWAGYPPVLLIAAGLMAVSAVALWMYPGEARPHRFQGWQAELNAMVAVYGTAWRNARLMRLLHVTLGWAAFAMAVVGFMAIRLARELGLSDYAFGLAVSVGSAGGLLANLAAAPLLDRVNIRLCSGLACAASGIAVLIAGFTDSTAVTVAMLIVFETVAAAHIAPSMVWVSREAGPGRIGGALAMHKVLTAIYGGLAILCLGALEPVLGLRGVLAVIGAGATILGAAQLLLPDPPAATGTVPAAR